MVYTHIKPINLKNNAWGLGTGNSLDVKNNKAENKSLIIWLND